MNEQSGEHTVDASRLGSRRGEQLTSEPLPESIGGYRILGKLGEGGMGVVYEAEQQEPRRVVALKVIRGGAAVDDAHVRMFQREVETLARLKHPDIGAIYESGRTSDGMHWFAMELVRGHDLAAWVAERPKTVTPQELRQRLRLVARIAQAVHYAHQRGVIHRDLKPSNIIVTEPLEGVSGAYAGVPEVKILDFGLARLTDEELHVDALTVAGAIKGTLGYMSPEQARGEIANIDVRTDVYALGIILYEVLTGQRPYDVARASLMEAVRVICEEPPRSITTSWSGSRRLDADVATIVGKALEKEPDRRYASASAFADDVERYLASEPILARPPSAVYQLRKFAQRHRPLVFGIAATSLAIVAGLIVSTSLYLRAEREKETAQQVATFLSSMLEGVGAQVAQGRDTALLRDILGKTAERIDTELAGDPEIEAHLRHTLGLAYHEIGGFDEAETQWNRALELYRGLRGEDDIDVAVQYSNLGSLAESRSDYAGAEQYLKKAVDIAERVAPRSDPRIPEFQARLANEMVNQARYDEARALLEVALARQREIFGGPHEDLAVTLNTLGNVNHYLGKLEEAEAYYREATDMHRQTLGDAHPFVATDLMNMAFLLDKRGKLVESEAAFRDALGRMRALYPDGNDALAACCSGLAWVLQKGNRFDEAEALSREALAINEKVYGPESVVYARALDGLATVLSAKGDRAGADDMGNRALAVRQKALGPRHPDVASSLNNMGMRKLDDGDFAGAQPLIEQAVDIQREATGVDSDTTLIFMNNLARAREGAGDITGAEQLFLDVIERRRNVLGKESPYVAVSEYFLSRMLRDQNRATDAEPLARESATIMKAAVGPDHVQTFLMELELAEVLTAVGKQDEAQSLARDVAERAAAAQGATSRPALDARTVLARSLSETGKSEEALRELDAVLEEGDSVLSETSLGRVRVFHGAALAASGRVAEGRAELKELQTAFVAKYGRDHRLSRLAAREIARLE